MDTIREIHGLCKGIIYERFDTCPICRTKRGIDLYDINNNPINFPLILDKERYDQLDKNRLYYFKCRKCKAEFKIQWDIVTGIPKPLQDKNLIRFFNEDYNNSHKG